MGSLVWGGSIVTLISVVMLGWCVVMALRIRKAGSEDAAMRAALQRVLVWNMAALALAALGLMAVVVGVVLS